MEWAAGSSRLFAKRLTRCTPKSKQITRTLSLPCDLEYLEHRWQDLEGYHAEAKVAKVLSGLGFRNEDFQRAVEEFSGGWQMRIALAKLLLLDPDLLMLDQPTNHLDLPALTWLEGYLTRYPGALIIVSHDKFFLDRVVNQIAELHRSQLRFYHGNYSAFEIAREERRAQLEAHALKLEAERKHVEDFIKRFRYKASKARQVQSRVKYLQKLRKIETESQRKKVHFRFPPAPASSRFVLELKGLSKSYGSKSVFSQVDLTLERGRRIALVGINGAGKSTLCRLIAGIDAPTSGSLKLGHNVTVDYFAQEADFHLNSANTLLEEMEQDGGTAAQSILRGMLGAFLFSGDDVFKTVSVLSGGEKSRLALAKMLLRPSNFIILDEPTNHLDIDSKDVLLDALRNYEGTLLVVSHDRYFLDRLVDRVLEIEDGVLRDWPGNLSKYLTRKHFADGNADSSLLASERIPVQSREVSAPKSRDQKRAEAEIRNRFTQALKSVQNEVDSLQRKIEKHEARKSALELKLANEEIYRDGEKSKEILNEYQKIRSELPALLDAWETASVRMQQLEDEKEQQVKSLGSVNAA